MRSKAALLRPDLDDHSIGASACSDHARLTPGGCDLLLQWLVGWPHTATMLSVPGHAPAHLPPRSALDPALARKSRPRVRLLRPVVTRSAPQTGSVQHQCIRHARAITRREQASLVPPGTADTLLYVRSMPVPPEPQFNWRGVILIAIAFALIALAILFGAGGPGADTPSLKQWIPTLSDLKAFSKVFVPGLFILMLAFLGSLCGYLRVMYKLRKNSRPHREGAATRKI